MSPRILKEVSSEVTPVLHTSSTSHYLQAIVPVDWKLANIFPLHKKRPRDYAENYRPISLTSVCPKILEHIVYSGISKHLENNHILSPRQHGFQPGFSCETQLVLAIDDWARTLDRGHETDIAIFDFSKAFDSVPHRRLITKLDYYGIRGNTQQWITSFLSDRSQCVLLNGTCSPPLPVISGVPEGTVLGPLLFLLCINDITDNVSSETRLFAMTVFYIVQSFHCLIGQYSKKTSTHFKTGHKSGKCFNAKKCHILNISWKRQKPCLHYQLG